jgi:crotonobetainyl-CoA:carnitine CoA-transferase CaiB-like acyl-CoA transferase
VLLTRHSGSQDWHRLMKAAGREDLIADPRFQNTALRRDNGPALIAALDEAFAKRDLEEWADILDEIDIVWAPVQTPAQVAADPQAQAAGAFVDVRAEDGNVFRSVASPVRFDGTDTAEFQTAPTAGAHTDEILQGLGFAPDKIAELRARRVIA